MRAIVFEDRYVAQLYPVTVGRPAFAISCGGYRLVDLIGRLGVPVGAVLRPHLVPLLEADFPQFVCPGDGTDGPTLLVNARLVPAASVFRRLRRLTERGKPGMVLWGSHVAAAWLGPDQPCPPSHGDAEAFGQWVESLALPPVELDLPLIEYPHDIVRQHAAILRENLEDRVGQGHYAELSDGLFVAPGATLGQYLVTDTRHGPIVVDQGASIGPYCYLSGPVYVGPRAKVIEHAALKDGVALGHTTKLGGEVEASIIEPYTNKQHHGFIGHSYLGSWVNLGAGTCNSDLKNTYGLVSMEYQGQRVATDMQFLGCIVGDYAKTAINTGIFTGKTVGVCSMVYGFVTTNVPSFTNYARSFGQVTEIPTHVIVASQARMFKRRAVTQRPCDIQLIHDMHALTRHERQLTNGPLAL